MIRLSLLLVPLFVVAGAIHGQDGKGPAPAITMPVMFDTPEADKVLETLAERSGGEAMFPGDIMTLGRSFDKLRDEIRSRYLIAYRPAGFEPNGKYRAITIVAQKNGKRLQVHARRGYHARIASSTP